MDILLKKKQWKKLVSDYPEISDAVDYYLSFLKEIKNYSDNTVFSYSTDLNQWISFLEEKKIHWIQVTSENFYQFIERLDKDKMSKSTWGRKSSSIRAFYRFALKNKWIEKNPLKISASFKYVRPLPHPVNPLDMSALLEDNSGQDHFIQKRDIALIDTLYSTGMRISELIPLNCSDFLDSFSIVEQLVVRGKGNKDRIVFIGKKAAKSLLEYFLLRGIDKRDLHDEPAFININGKRITRQGVHYILQKRKDLLKINRKLSAHSFRHSFATDLMNEGADLRRIQEMLGHSRLSTTQRYTQVAKDRIRDVYRDSHPHAVDDKNNKPKG